MDNSLTKEIIAKTIADAMLNIFDAGDFDFSKAVNSEGAIIANKIHQVLNKYNFYNEHGYTGGTIHDFD